MSSTLDLPRGPPFSAQESQGSHSKPLAYGIFSWFPRYMTFMGVNSRCIRPNCARPLGYLHPFTRWPSVGLTQPNRGFPVCGLQLFSIESRRPTLGHFRLDPTREIALRSHGYLPLEIVLFDQLPLRIYSCADLRTQPGQAIFRRERETVFSFESSRTAVHYRIEPEAMILLEDIADRGATRRCRQKQTRGNTASQTTGQQVIDKVRNLEAGGADYIGAVDLLILESLFVTGNYAKRPFVIFAYHRAHRVNQNKCMKIGITFGLNESLSSL